MRLIALNNKENIDGDVVHHQNIFSAVSRRNQPWPCRLRQRFPFAVLKHLKNEPHFPSRFALRAENLCQQQNINLIVNRA